MQGLFSKTLRIIIGIFFACSFTLFSGCSSVSSAVQAVLPDHTLLALFSVPDKLNVNQQGQSSPLFVYIFQLKTIDTFQQATFFQLYNNPKKSLGSSAADMHKIMLVPGKKAVHINLPLKKGVTAIGLVANYSDIVWHKWRILIPANCDWGAVRVHVGFDNKGMHIVQ